MISEEWLSKKTKVGETCSKEVRLIDGTKRPDRWWRDETAMNTAVISIIKGVWKGISSSLNWNGGCCSNQLLFYFF